MQSLPGWKESMEAQMRRLLVAADNGEDVAAEALAKEAQRLRMTHVLLSLMCPRKTMHAYNM